VVWCGVWRWVGLVWYGVVWCGGVGGWFSVGWCGVVGLGGRRWAVCVRMESWSGRGSLAHSSFAHACACACVCVSRECLNLSSSHPLRPLTHVHTHIIYILETAGPGQEKGGRSQEATTAAAAAAASRGGGGGRRDTAAAAGGSAPPCQDAGGFGFGVFRGGRGGGRGAG
jgi:hypothetical protein